jgi:hypothetical protein
MSRQVYKGRTTIPPPKCDRDGYVRCRVCGCTEREPCEPPCAWFDASLCTLCAMASEALAEWTLGAHRPSRAALWREAKRRAADELAEGR